MRAAVREVIAARTAHCLRCGGGPPHLGGHDEAGALGLDGHVAREEPDGELLGKIPELLVRDGLDGRRVDGLCAVARGERERVLGHHRLPGARVRGHEHVLPALEQAHGRLLEVVELEGVVHGQVGPDLFKLHLRAEGRGRVDGVLVLVALAAGTGRRLGRGGRAGRLGGQQARQLRVQEVASSH